jgi:hypothetical protein
LKPDRKYQSKGRKERDVGPVEKKRGNVQGERWRERSGETFVDRLLIYPKQNMRECFHI